MSENDETANQMSDVLVRAWSFAPLDVEQLLRDRWAPYPEHDTRTWWVLQNAPHWTDEVLAIACSVVQRTDIGPFQIDHVIGTLGVNQPEAAFQLVRAQLDHELDIAQARSAELAKEEKPEFDSGAEDAGWSAEEVAWAFEKNPKIPLRELIEDKNGWDTLPTLAEQAPSLFLEILWPWFERCFDAIAARSEDQMRDLQYALAHDADFRFEEEQDTDLVEPALLGALRTAVERLAETNPDEWLAWATKLRAVEVTPVQRLIAHSFTVASERFAGPALEFLLEDNRRYALGSIHGMTGTSSRLVEAVNAHWSAKEVERFESAMKRYNPTPGADLTDVEQRRSWRSIVRRIKLSVLRALPKHRLTAKNRRHIEQEERVFPDAHLGTRFIGRSSTGSVMDAAAMARAADKDVIKAFRTLPDETGWDHPTRFMAGGNMQLSREFAEFSKENPERAGRVLRSLDPESGTRAAGYTLDAMSEKTAANRVLELLHDMVDRGFDGEEFRRSASRAVEKLVKREVPIDDETVAVFEKWLAQPSADAADSDDTDRETVTETAMESAADDRKEEDCTHRSMLWGHGGISTMPDGDYPVLEALIRILLARGQIDRVYQTLSGYLDRCTDPQAWDRVLLILSRPEQEERPRRAAFLKRLFAEVRGLVESKAAAYAVMNSRRWSKGFADSELDRWKDSERASVRQTYGEIVAMTSLMEPSLAWAGTRRDELVNNPALKDARAGAALTAAHRWRCPAVRPRAADLLLALLPEDDPDVWKAVSEILQMLDELTPDEPTIALLEAISQKPGHALRRNANFVATGLATLLPHEAELVARVAESLISDWRKELGDTKTTAAMAAQELVDLAVTLHRLGPNTRGVGTKLFEELLEIDTHEARQTLDELDSRFREKAPGRRPRLARYRRRRPQR